MSENRMAEVAKLFGKELDEEFIVNEYPARYYYLYTKRRKVKVWDPKIGWTMEYESECNAPDSHQVKCKFTKNGLFTCDEWSKGWRYDECTLSDLIRGLATIVGEQKIYVGKRKKLI